jgi:hypothetical protein
MARIMKQKRRRVKRSDGSIWGNYGPDDQPGRLAEARSEARAGLTIYPTFTIARFRASELSDDPIAVAGRERVVDGLRNAGLPEE